MPSALLHILADQTTTHYYRLSRVAAMDQWWHWLLLAAAVLLVLVYVAWMYRRDGVELPRGTTILLALLRLGAFAGILLFFLQLEKRSDREVTRPSRVAVLVDTSQSMGLSDAAPEGSPQPPSRQAQVIAAF